MTSTSAEQPAALTTVEAATLASSKANTQDASGRQPAPSTASASELASTKISLLAALRRFPDFPIPGINFIDILPIFQDPATHNALLRALELQVLEAGFKPDVVVGLDARGFLFGPSLALRLDASFVPVRKQGKLPGPCVTATYEKEYGQDFFQMQKGAITPGQKVLVVDDIIATGMPEKRQCWAEISALLTIIADSFESGGSAAAAGSLVKQLGGSLVGYLFMLEIPFLKGRDKLDGVSTVTLLETDD